MDSSTYQIPYLVRDACCLPLPLAPTACVLIVACPHVHADCCLPNQLLYPADCTALQIIVSTGNNYLMKMARRRFKIGRKLQIITRANERMARGESLRSCARRFGIQAIMLKKWRQDFNKLKDVGRGKKSCHPGKQSTISHLKPALMEHIKEQRTLNLPVSYYSVMAFAGTLDQDFSQRPVENQYNIIRCFAKASGIVIRARTNQAQEKPAEVFEKSQNWMSFICPILNQPDIHQQFIINMDETPVPFSMASKRTLTQQGDRTVGIRRTGCSTTRATAALTVCSDGSKLKPFVIFKGKPGGRISRNELPTFPNQDRIAYTVQENAWMDGSCMLQWIDNILVPHLQCRPAATEVILLLDDLTSHTSDQTKDRLAQLGISLYIIPGGCTGNVQPLDVGINKPFKDRLRRKWWQWVVEGGANRSVFQNPGRAEVGNWIEQSWSAIPVNIVQNSWYSTDFNYFEEEN